jgi:hypothetical protein
MDIGKIKQDKVDEQTKFEAEQKEKSEIWKNHWDKEKNPITEPKKLAGGKRPKFFDTDKVDYENNSYTRPLSADSQKLKDERLLKEKNLKNDKELLKKSKEIPESDKDFKKFRE